VTPAEFKKKWAKYTGKESSAYQEHFNDLCHLLKEPTPAEADSSGADFFCFQKRVVKDAELFDVDAPDSSDPHERGFPFPFRDDLLPLPENPDRTYAENLAAHNYYVGKEDSAPYGNAQKTPDEHRAAIAAAAKNLNELRERWLNPPEWTVERILEFPGSAHGSWARYFHNPDKNGIGTVRYPRLEPRDADCATKLKKRTLTNLYNERPAWLDLAHKKLDAAVAAAYGWPADLSDEQILEKLLALNLVRAAEEAKQASGEKREKTTRAKHADEMI
jgi:hypothetical protein